MVVCVRLTFRFTALSENVKSLWIAISHSTVSAVRTCDVFWLWSKFTYKNIQIEFW